MLACCAEVGCAPDGPNLPWTLIHERLGPSPRRISVLSRKWRGMLSAERRSSDEQNARWYAPRDDHILLRRIRAQRKASTPSRLVCGQSMADAESSLHQIA